MTNPTASAGRIAGVVHDANGAPIEFRNHITAR